MSNKTMLLVANSNLGGNGNTLGGRGLGILKKLKELLIAEVQWVYVGLWPKDSQLGREGTDLSEPCSKKGIWIVA